MDIIKKKHGNRFIDITGKNFGKWIVIDYYDNDKYDASRWLCRCECGTERIVRSRNLINGTSKSCGCTRKEAMINNTINITHGHTINKKRSLTYKSWRAMLQRCNDPNQSSYKDYGAKGIKVCEEWQGENGFINFLEDMGERPGKEYSIDRIDNNLGYYKSNCRWATQKEQNRNRRNNINVFFEGKIRCLQDCIGELRNRART